LSCTVDFHPISHYAGLTGTTVTLADLLHPETVARCLVDGGLSPTAVARQAEAFARVARALRSHGVESNAFVHAFFVPGRIEVLGKHTDYAGGGSLTCAVERGLALIIVPEAAPVLHVVDARNGEVLRFGLQSDLAPRAGHWSNYARTVARRVARNFPGPLRGGRVAWASDLPRAAGMSSSSALIVAVFLALSAVNDLPRHAAYRHNMASREALAHYLGCVENGETFGTLAGDRGVGTFGGSEDHTAILCSAPGMLRHYVYAPTRFVQAAPMPQGYTFVLATSGIRAAKTGVARVRYNRAALLAAAAAQAWRTATGRNDPHLAAAAESPGFSAERMGDILHTAADSSFSPDDLRTRFDHFYLEHVLLLPPAVEALRTGDVAAFGDLVDRSQRAATRLLKNQVDETIFLARQARRLGAGAASAFGAGFGGSVWALARADEAEAMKTAWKAQYAAAFPPAAWQALFFIDRPGPAAFELGGVSRAL